MNVRYWGPNVRQSFRSANEINPERVNLITSLDLVQGLHMQSFL